jgi:hypothetical protein
MITNFNQALSCPECKTRSFDIGDCYRWVDRRNFRHPASFFQPVNSGSSLVHVIL